MDKDNNLMAISDEIESEISTLYDKYFTDDESTDETLEESVVESETTEETSSHPEADAGEETTSVETTDTDTDDVEGEVEDEVDASGEAETEAIPQSHIVKINGVEHQVEYDELVRGYQTMRAANEKFEAAASKEKELNEYVEFGQNFVTTLKESPAELFSEYIELVEEPNEVIAALIERVAALGKLHPTIAEAFGITETEALRAQAEFQTTKRQQLEAQINRDPEVERDQFGYSADDYREIIPELVVAAGIADSDPAVQQAFFQSFGEYRTNKQIANPYLALAQMQREQMAAKADATATAAAKAVQQATKKRIPAASTSAGQVPPPLPSAPGPITDHHEAARRAVEELFGE